jgi:hypothetical protein
MAKLFLFRSLLKMASLCVLTTACQTVDDTTAQNERSLYQEQQMRDSTIHGAKERVAPLLTKTIVVDDADSQDIEPESEITY